MLPYIGEQEIGSYVLQVLVESTDDLFRERMFFWKKRRMKLVVRQQLSLLDTLQFFDIDLILATFYEVEKSRI